MFGALAASVLFGCAPKAVVRPSESPAAPTTAAPVAEAPREAATDDAGEGPLAADPIYFQLDSSQLAAPSQDELARVAERLRRSPGVQVRIEGYTCELGTAEYNLALGLRRAQVTREYLVRMGVDAARIETISYGEERPASEGTTEDARAKNRRSELHFSPSGQHSRR